MIPTPNQVWLVVEPIDMRAGIDGLSQRIQNTLGRSPCDGSAYAFPISDDPCSRQSAEEPETGFDFFCENAHGLSLGFLVSAGLM